MNRPPADVFEDHLRLRSAGDLETDLQMNYADDVILLCEFGSITGRDAVRQSARRLGLQLPEARFEFPTKSVLGEYAFLVWTARSQKFVVHYGADSFVIRGGRIAVQTIFYRLDDGQNKDQLSASRAPSRGPPKT